MNALKVCLFMDELRKDPVPFLSGAMHKYKIIIRKVMGGDPVLIKMVSKRLCGTDP